MNKYIATEIGRLLRRGIALLLVIIIALSLLPGAAFTATAEETDGTMPTTVETSPTDATEPEDTTPTTDSTLPQETEPDGNTPPADDPDGGNPPADDQNDGNPPADDQSGGNPPTDDQSSGNPSGDTPTGDTPLVNEPLASLYPYVRSETTMQLLMENVPMVNYGYLQYRSPAQAFLATRAGSSTDLPISKTTTPLGNGTYDLQLTVQGSSGTEESAVNVDFVFVMDRSNSMTKNSNDGTTRYRMQAAQAAANGFIENIEKNEMINARYKIIDFSGSGHPKSTDQAVMNASVNTQKIGVIGVSSWFSTLSSAKSGINAVTVYSEQLFDGDGLTSKFGTTLNGKKLWYAVRATNYEAAFETLNSVNDYRSDALKVVIFMTDGNPTCTWTEVKKYWDSTDQRYELDGKWNSELHGTTHDLPQNVAVCLEESLDEIGAINEDHFYVIGFGEVEEANLNTVINTATNVVATNKKPFLFNIADGKEPTQAQLTTTITGFMNEINTKITANVEELFYSNVTITDILSHNADGELMVDVTDPSTIKVTVKNGSTVIGSGSSVSLPATSINSAATVTAKRVNDNLVLSFNPATYKLEPDLTYILSATIKPTEAAYREYRKQDETYSGDYADDSNGGFHSNDGATISYTYSGNTYSQSFVDYPIIQVHPSSLIVTKRFTGLSESEIANLNDLSFAVTLTYPGYGTSISAETVTRNIPFSDMTKNTDGSYFYEVTGLSPGTTYSVTESGGQVANYNMSTTATGATGTVAEGATATAAYQNSYVPTTSIKIEKQVTGNMGSWEQEFDFTASLSTSMAGLSYVKYAKNSNGEPVAGNNTAITTETLNFKLKDNEYIVLYQVPVGTNLTISETLNSYDGYTLENVQATNLGSQQLTQSGTSVTLPVSSRASANSYGHIVTFTNDKTMLIDTGIALDSLPYVLVLIGVAVAGLFLFLRKPRSYED